MTTNEKKRKILTYTVMALLITGIFSIMSTSAPSWLGVALFGAGMLLLVINSIGTLYYSKGAKYLKGSIPDVKKALPYLEKAVKFGTDAQAEIIAGTLFVQYGDMEKGRKVLEGHIEAKDKKINGQARVSLSMYYWVKRDLDKALELAQGVYDSDYKDRNLYVNLLTYYLEKGRYKDFEKLLKESKKLGLNVPATLDLEASYYMSQSDWAKCGAVLKKLFGLTKPGFIDPYLHMAVVYLHYGEWEEAIKSLEAIGSNVEKTNTALFSGEQIELLISYIKDENTRWGLLKALENDPTILIRRTMPEVEKGVPAPTFPPLPSFKDVLPPEEITEKDEDDIDTSLTDEDEEWIKKHS